MARWTVESATTLREARNRRKLSLSEVEAATKISARYLRAIENEEWDALPGGAYARAFIRTYADLPRPRRRAAGRRAPPRAPRPAPAGGRRAGGRRGRRSPRGRVRRSSSPPWRRWRWRSGSPPAAAGRGAVAGTQHAGAGAGGRPGEPSGDSPHAPNGVELSLATTAEVWVCVLDAKGRALVEGQVLADGAEEGPFHSGSFTVAFGNGEVAMRVDGKDIRIPASASPLGYSIDSGGRLTPLAEAERPTCL